MMPRWHDDLVDHFRVGLDPEAIRTRALLICLVSIFLARTRNVFNMFQYYFRVGGPW